MNFWSRERFDRRFLCAVVLLAGSLLPPAIEAADTANITRATLRNGLRVVIVRNPLAPVVTVELNYLAGANETPAGFPGMAHAQERMAFRGCEGRPHWIPPAGSDGVAGLWLAAIRLA